MLKKLKKKNEYVFNTTLLKHFRTYFNKQRRRVSTKLGNPNISRISFKTLRHFKATMEYHRTKDILHVMQILGHKNIKNTLVYTHLVDLGEEQYISKVVRNADEACKLIENGFEYVCSTPDDLMVFRTRK